MKKLSGGLRQSSPCIRVSLFFLVEQVLLALLALLYYRFLAGRLLRLELLLADNVGLLSAYELIQPRSHYII